MSYTYILSLIDTQIDLLRQARRLLTAPEPLIQKQHQPKSDTARAAAVGLPATTPHVEQASAMPLPAAPVLDPTPSVITLIPPKKARRSSRLQPVKRPVAALTALNGPVPAGPFFVSAEQARSLEAQREESRTAAQNISSSTPAAPLTAEALARSWLINSRL